MAFCANCGTQLSDTDRVCPNCGQAAGDRPAHAAAPAALRRTDGTAIASLVLGVLGFGCFVFSILAIVLGSQAKTKIDVDPTLEGEGLAKAGTILGWVGLGLNMLWMLVFFGGMFTIGTMQPSGF